MTTPRGRASPFAVPTGLFIRDYLLAHGEAYAQEIWRALKEKRREMGLKVCSYNTFWVNYIRNLKALGLITEVRRGKAPPGLKRKVYFMITPGREDDPAWLNPQDARYKVKELRKRWRERRTK